MTASEGNPAQSVEKTITVACAQVHPVFGEPARNLTNTIQLGRSSDDDLIVFPELATSGYDFADRSELSRLAIDPATDGGFAFLVKAARESGTHVVVGFPESAGDAIYNSATLIEPDERCRTYRKIHLFDREKRLFDAGDRPFEVINTAIGTIGIMIWFDWVFPEAARVLALGGMQILCHPSNLVLTYCQQAMYARAVENSVFVLTCNRIGTESRAGRSLTFTGSSQILSNRGQVLARAGVTTEEVITAGIDPAAADDKMLTASNDLLADRRPEF